MCGSKDKDHRNMAKIAKAYKAAGLVNTDFVSVANVNRNMPGTSSIENAVKYLDERP
jgi:hypothetical protein